MPDKSKLQTFHATMLVTRAEEWCVEAATAEEAKALLESGRGHRCSPGEVFAVELGEDPAWAPDIHSRRSLNRRANAMRPAQPSKKSAGSTEAAARAGGSSF